jgi:DNA-binding response OmpR family regulator
MLVVEDDATLSEAIGALFSAKGWEVQAAHTVTYALWLLSDPFECIIVDLVLPDGSGEAILEAVSASRMIARVVVIAGTGDDSQLHWLRERFRLAGVFRKPVDLGAIEATCSAIAIDRN